jgi:DNA repair protein RecO
MIIEAIVIKKFPLREHDQMVVLYSREIGKCSAIAKGSLRSHSKQALALDDGNRIQCELVSGKTGYIITGAQVVNAYHNGKSSPLCWAAAQFFLQAIDMLIYDAQPDAHLWACLTDTLGQLDSSSDNDAIAVFRQRQCHLLETLGYGKQSEAELDDYFQRIAQRTMTSLTLLYDIAAHRYS